jgi:hypothetical protein
MTNDAATPHDTVVALMQGAVPERKDEIKFLWDKYNPDVVRLVFYFVWKRRLRRFKFDHSRM